MCFSATANFVGSGVLATVGVVTLTRVKHRRELLFAALPTLFAVHQFIEGFVWLGLDGILSPKVTHDMGAAFMLYAQGLLPFLLPVFSIPNRIALHRSRNLAALDYFFSCVMNAFDMPGSKVGMLLGIDSSGRQRLGSKSDFRSI
jgi:uncharacterized membrane protein